MKPGLTGPEAGHEVGLEAVQCRRRSGCAFRRIGDNEANTLSRISDTLAQICRKPEKNEMQWL